MLKKQVIPFVVLALGIFSLYWAQTHSPDTDLGSKIGREMSGSYTLSTPGYIFSLIFSTALIVLGGKRLIKGLRNK